MIVVLKERKCECVWEGKWRRDVFLAQRISRFLPCRRKYLRGEGKCEQWEIFCGRVFFGGTGGIVTMEFWGNLKTKIIGN